MKKEAKIIILSTLTVLFASFLRKFPTISAPFKLFLYMISMLLVLSMIFGWAIHIHQQIIQVRLRRYMGYMSMLMILWIFLRYSRFYLFDDLYTISRHLWYLYYIPMLYIPLTAFLFSLHFGRSFDWEEPKIYKALSIITFLFLMLVLLNDKLQLIFIFEDIQNFSDYEYGTVYFMMIIYIIGLIVAMLINLMRKSVMKPISPKAFNPFIVLAFGVLYIYLYVIVRDHWLVNFVDLTLMMNYINMMFWMSILSADLIPVNRDHKRYFEEASFKAQIMSPSKEILLKNINSHELTEDMKDEILEKGHIFLSDYILLNSSLINQNTIIWEEDHEHIQKSLAKKREIQSELLDELSILRLDLGIQKKSYSLSIKNEMYDEALTKVEKDIETIEHYIHQNDLFKVTYWGIVLKRKLNLILLSHSNQHSSLEELRLSLQEVLQYLSQMDYKTSLDFNLEEDSSLVLYEAFENITHLISQEITDTKDIHVSLFNTQNIKVNDKEVKLYA